MKRKNIVITVVMSLIILVLFIVDYIYGANYNRANKAYLVYFNGEKIGLIEDNEKLYELINTEQQEIKSKYQVDAVYPPNGFELVATNTFDENYTSVNEIYNKIAELDSFTIKGYIITIKFPKDSKDEDKKEDITINVLDKDVFDKAIRKFILAFISEEELNEYIEGQKRTLTEVGKMITSMYFNETITIKEGYVSTDAEIYTDVDTLSQYLLFGSDAKINTYTVKLGDSIESISEAHDLNPQELIIANPVYRDEKTILKVGTKVNVTLLNPVLTYVYEVDQIEETKVAYAKKSETDKTKEVGYKEISQPGVTGLRLDYESYQVTNGEASSEVIFDKERSKVIREAVDEITIVGPKRPSGGGPITGNQQIWDGDWTWPTNQPSKITSRYGWRWGKLHAGTDISGTGYGSPIYAIGDGVVVKAQLYNKKSAQWANGNFVVIKHDNNIYSAYLHMSAFNVKVGDVVSKGQRVGSMGESGLAYGTHLHLGIFIGEPYAGVSNSPQDACKTVFKGRC